MCAWSWSQAEVLDKQGNPVTDLQEKDFVVKENGKEMKITHFARLTDRPVSLAIVLDTSATPREQISIAKEYIIRLAHTLSRDDEMCLFTFNEKDAVLEQDFTQDRAPLLESLRNIHVPYGKGRARWKDLIGSPPRAGLGVDLALQNLRKGRNEKRSALVISNRFKGLGPATVEHVQESGYTILTLAFANKTSWLPTFGGAPLKSANSFTILSVDFDQMMSQMSKRAIMEQSGGRKFSAEAEDITGVCKSIVYALKNHYSLGYPTEVASTGRQKARTVELLLPGKNHAIYARRSYIPSP